MKRLFVAGFIAATVAFAAPATEAAGFPDGPVQVIVPSAPGSGMDNLARVIAIHLEQVTGQAFPVLNKPGAGQTVAARFLLQAKPNGQTILIAHSDLLNSTARNMLDFNPLEKFKPLAQTGRMENFLTSPQNAPFSDLAGLKEYALAHPGEVNAAIDGVGGLDYILLQQLSKEMGIKLNFVSAPGGGPAKVQSLMGGFTSLGVLGPGPFAGVKKSGDLKGIATLTDSDDPSLAFPDVPTTKKQGYSADFEVRWWWFVRADTPDDTYKALVDLMAKVMADPATQKDIVERGISEASYADPAVAKEQLAKELEGMQEVVREVGLVK